MFESARRLARVVSASSVCLSVIASLAGCGGGAAALPVERAPIDTGDSGGGVVLPSGPIRRVSAGVTRSILQESGWCWMARTGAQGVDVDVLGLDTATVASFASGPPGARPLSPMSVFEENGRLVVAGVSGRAGRTILFDAQTGAFRRDVASDPGGLHRTDAGYFRGEPSNRRPLFSTTLRDAVNGVGRRVSLPAGSSQMGNGTQALATSWHSTDTIDLVDTTTFGVQASVRLEAFDTWVVDLQHTGRRLYVMDDGRGGWVPAWTPVLAVFQGVTGANLSNYAFPAGEYSAFFCTGVGP